MTTIATGGFANYDASFGALKGPIEYIATVFMLAAALPFVLYVRLLNSEAKPIFQDAQVRAFLGTFLVIAAVVTWVLVASQNRAWEPSVREALFNVASILTGTGYASANYMLWGGFLISIFFFIGLIGGCAGSTTCSVKVFRYQILFAAAKAQIRRIHSPHGIFTPRYAGRSVTEDVMNSVMAFFVMFIVSLGVFAVALAMTGLDFVTAVSGAATALANVGPGLGDRIGPAGNFAGLSDPAKVILTAAMLIGRLELMAVYVLFTRRFWVA
jgi:trk system potassium uptake protein TrkH